MAFLLSDIDNITELKSEIHYIKRFIGRITGTEVNGSEEKEVEFYIFFSLEIQPLGKPIVTVKYIDPPNDHIKSAEQEIVERILEMEKERELKHTPFNGL